MGGTRARRNPCFRYLPLDPDVDDVHRISYKVALESLHLNSQKGERAAGGGAISR